MLKMICTILGAVIVGFAALVIIGFVGLSLLCGAILILSEIGEEARRCKRDKDDN